MVPIKLHLRNFMCYRGQETVVDFSGIHLACLAGDNGQGKSALLDAMTWALWGKARTRRDDDLITHGETEMQVQLDFDLAGTRYRVLRKRNAAGRGSSILELQGQRAGGSYASLSEAHIRDTQARISELLRLDYDTFVNSAFLLQGRADEFTTKKPAERKQILADILGLAAYDRYAERAKQQGRERAIERGRIERELTAIRGQVALIPTLEEAVVQADSLVQAARAELRQAVQQHQTLLDQRRTLDAKAEMLTQSEKRVQEGQGEVAKLEQRLDEHRRALASYDELLGRAPLLERDMQALAEARIEKERWDDLLRQSLQLEKESSAIQREVDAARAALASELSSAQTKAAAAQKQLDRNAEQEQVLAEAEGRVRALEQLQRERDERQQQLKELGETKGRLEAENRQLRTVMGELKERMALLQESEESNCPVCRRPLSAEARAQALADAQAEGTTMGDHYRANQRAQQQLALTVAATDNAIQRDAKQLAELGSWQRRAATAASAARAIAEARGEKQAAEGEATALRARLDSGDYAHEAQNRLAQLGSANASLGYQQTPHESAKATIQRLAPREQEFERLREARTKRSGVVEIITALEENVANWQARIGQERAAIAALRVDLTAREAVQQQVMEAQGRVNQLQKEVSEADRHLGGERQKLHFAEQQAAREPEVSAAYHAAVEETSLYEQLANAFGKRGVQAMIIESALPDLEQEANRLLGRMTDGRMSVALLTQRAGKTTDAPIETLDIVIADEMGERPYETFSGGEAFRVNFALRIALSRLLANRAGTSVRTLVIDEGFGSQDAQGRERLIEAITSVQEEFERVLVITHIEELKDAFPTRIDVVKGANGSRVVVNSG